MINTKNTLVIELYVGGGHETAPCRSVTTGSIIDLGGRGQAATDMLWNPLQCFQKNNIFTEMEFTYHKIHAFKVDNSLK